MSRYIDADKELKALENMNLSELGEQEKFGVRYAKVILSNSPTADVQEVKHGRWVKDESNYWVTENGREYDYKCSNCGHGVLYNKLGDMCFSPICPDCGTIMDEEIE